MASRKRRRTHNWAKIRRDTVIWLMGIGLTLNEFLLEERIRAEALVFCGLLLGLPKILDANEAAKRLLGAVSEEDKA